MSLIVLDIELTEKKIIKELGLHFDGSLQRFSLCPPKTCKPNKQTTWSSEKLDYGKLFAVFYDIKVMNADVFAKRLEKCRLLTTLLGQIVEILNDHGCPKIQDLFKTDSLDSFWKWSSYPFRLKTRFHCAERKTKVCGEWVMQNL